MTKSLLVARNNRQELRLLPLVAYRRGLVTGASEGGIGGILESDGSSRRESAGAAPIKSIARSIGSAVGYELIRGMLGSPLKFRR